MKFAAKALATFFGLGYFPAAPGTLASLAAVFLYKYLLHPLPWPVYAAVVIVLFLVAVAASGLHARVLNVRDPGVIVIDEVCGQLAALFLVPSGWLFILAGFVLFRFFDILKPLFIRRVEKLPGGWGIMTDDLAAAAYSAVLLHGFILLRGARLK